MIERILCVLIGYGFGCLQFAYILGKILKGVDIRKYGSGNAGTTNAIRVLGTKIGITTLVLDIVKAVAALVVIALLWGYDQKQLLLWGGIGVVLGHNYPFYMQFKGGKGIASTFGLILSFHPWFIPMGFIVFLGIFMTTHYVSLGSLLIYAGFVIQMIIMGQNGNLGEINQNVLNEMYLIAFLLMAMAYWKHRENIKRLLTGTERKTYLFKKNKSE